MGTGVSLPLTAAAALWLLGKKMLTIIGETLILHIAAMSQVDWCKHASLFLHLFFLFCLFHRRAAAGAESRHGPVPVVHLWVAAGRHRVIRGECGGSCVWGQTLPTHPGHIPRVPFRARGWAAPASDTVTSSIVSSTALWLCREQKAEHISLCEGHWWQRTPELLHTARKNRFTMCSVPVKMCCGAIALDLSVPAQFPVACPSTQS